MEIELSDITIDFFKHDISDKKQLAVMCSSGTDSTILLYLTALRFPDRKILPYHIEESQYPKQKPALIKNINLLNQKLPNSNLLPLLSDYVNYCRIGSEWRLKAKEEPGELPPRRYGNEGQAKILANRHYIKQRFNDGSFDYLVSGATSNPPKEVLNREPVKSEVIEKTETEVVYTEDICDDPMGCPQDVKTGDCPTCKKVKVYEEKVIQKVPTEVKINHTLLTENHFVNIKEGNYSLTEVRTMHGTDYLVSHIHNGLELNVKKLSHNEFYFSFSGGANVVEKGNRIAVSCPKPDKYILSLDEQGNVDDFTHLHKGSCQNFKGLSQKYSFNNGTLTRVRVSRTAHCHVGCDGNGDVYKTEIHSYRFNSGFNG